MTQQIFPKASYTITTRIVLNYPAEIITPPEPVYYMLDDNHFVDQNLGFNRDFVLGERFLGVVDNR